MAEEGGRRWRSYKGSSDPVCAFFPEDKSLETACSWPRAQTSLIQSAVQSILPCICLTLPLLPTFFSILSILAAAANINKLVVHCYCQHPEVSARSQITTGSFWIVRYKSERRCEKQDKKKELLTGDGWTCCHGKSHEAQKVAYGLRGLHGPNQLECYRSHHGEEAAVTQPQEHAHNHKPLEHRALRNHYGHHTQSHE